MADKSFNVEFYQIEVEGDNAQPFETYLENLLEGYKPDYGKQFFGTIHEASLRHHWHGTINIVRKDYLPQVYNTDNATARDIGLADAEGLLSVCAFMYVPQKKLLLVLKDFGAPGFSLLLDHVKSKNELRKCEASILLKKEMYDKLSKAGEIKSFVFKTARIEPDAFSKEDSAIDFVQSLTKISYGEMSVTLKSRKGNELTKSWVTKLVDMFKRQPREKVKELKVAVGGDDRKVEILNMLDYAFVVKVTMATVNKTVQPDERERALEKAYDDALKELAELGI